MKKYHLTILRNGNYLTIFAELRSITSFILSEKDDGNDTLILYSREMSDYEWDLIK
jgi:hypothetical protein